MAAKQIFIVEDEALLLCELEDMVLQLGYDVAGSATSFERAMDALAAGAKPDLALLDLNLNGTPSAAIADHLVAAGIPIIFVSGYGARGLEDRFTGFEVLQKPYDEAALSVALKRALAPAG